MDEGTWNRVEIVPQWPPDMETRKDHQWIPVEGRPGKFIRDDGLLGLWSRTGKIDLSDCIEFFQYHNGPGPHEDFDQIHICDIEWMIAALQDLLRFAEAQEGEG